MTCYIWKRPGDDDPNAFRRAMAGVRPLPGRPAVPARPRPGAVARFTRADRRDLLHESHAMAADPAELETDGELTFRRPCVRDETFRKLRRGRFAVEAEIDLHGLHRHAAQEALRQFLNDCVHRGLRCVRVIHGKGLRSGHGSPVLKLVVHHWLRKVENVAAFATARREAPGCTGSPYYRAGGSASFNWKTLNLGAMYVWGSDDEGFNPANPLESCDYSGGFVEIDWAGLWNNRLVASALYNWIGPPDYDAGSAKLHAYAGLVRYYIGDWSAVNVALHGEYAYRTLELGEETTKEHLYTMLVDFAF